MGKMWASNITDYTGEGEGVGREKNPDSWLNEEP